MRSFGGNYWGKKRYMEVKQMELMTCTCMGREIQYDCHRKWKYRVINSSLANNTIIASTIESVLI